MPYVMLECAALRSSSRWTNPHSQNLPEQSHAFVPCLPLHGACIRHASQLHRPQFQVTSLHRISMTAKVDLSRPNSRPFAAWSTILTRLPQPVVIARRQLNQDFAVLLMRSGYAAVDELDFVPMQQFQAVFFDIRSREWEKFIKVVFEEAYGDADGSFKTRIVKRDITRYPTPESLLFEWERMVGDKVCERMIETVKRPVAVMGADNESIMRGIKDIYDYFYIAGFCLDIRWTDTNDGQTGCRVEMVAPCTLWGSDALRRLKSIPNDYDCLCVRVFCEKCGVAVDCHTTITENSIVRGWSI